MKWLKRKSKLTDEQKIEKLERHLKYLLKSRGEVAKDLMSTNEQLDLERKVSRRLAECISKTANNDVMFMTYSMHGEAVTPEKILCETRAEVEPKPEKMNIKVTMVEEGEGGEEHIMEY